MVDMGKILGFGLYVKSWGDIYQGKEVHLSYVKALVDSAIMGKSSTPKDDGFKWLDYQYIVYDEKRTVMASWIPLTLSS